jgi:hypothetical protein
MVHVEQDKSEKEVQGPVWKLPTGHVDAQALQATGEEPAEVKPDLHVHEFDNASHVALASLHVQTSLDAVFAEPVPQIAHV